MRTWEDFKKEEFTEAYIMYDYVADILFLAHTRYHPFYNDFAVYIGEL